MSAESVQTLLLEVAARPADLSARLVLADALIERGDPRGEFIALQCKEQPTAADQRRAAQLLAQHRDDWLSAPVRAVIDPRSVVFERGFLVACRLLGPVPFEARLALEWATVRRLANPMVELFELCPLVSELSEVHEYSAARIIALGERPLLRRINVVSHANFDRLLRAWQTAGGLASLERLELTWRGTGVFNSDMIDPVLRPGPRLLDHLEVEAANHQRLERWRSALIGSPLQSLTLASHREAPRQHWEARLERGSAGGFSILRLRGDQPPADEPFFDEFPPRTPIEALAQFLDGIRPGTFERVTCSPPDIISSVPALTGAR